MKKQIAKKTLILYVLKTLESYPEENKPITYTNMAKILNSIGIQYDKKTIGRNVNYLIEFGGPIVKVKNGGCYLDKKGHSPLLNNVNFKQKKMLITSNPIVTCISIYFYFSWFDLFSK